MSAFSFTISSWLAFFRFEISLFSFIISKLIAEDALGVGVAEGFNIAAAVEFEPVGQAKMIKK